MFLLRKFAPLLWLLPLPALAAPIGEAGARLLLSRTGFGAPPAQVAALAPLEPEAAVDRILAGSRTEPASAPPPWTAEALLHPPRKQLSEDEKKALRDTETQRGLALRGWWLQEMATTPSPSAPCALDTRYTQQIQLVALFTTVAPTLGNDCLKAAHTPWVDASTGSAAPAAASAVVAWARMASGTAVPLTSSRPAGVSKAISRRIPMWLASPASARRPSSCRAGTSSSS